MTANATGPRLGAGALRRLLGDWRTEPARGRPASYRELAGRVELLVVDGRLPHGTRLPAERELAAALAISRTTVAGAYGELRERGLLRSVRGSGSVVGVPATPTTAGDGRRAIADLSHATLPGWDELPRHFAAANDDLPRLLRTHAIDYYGIPELRGRLAQRFSDRGVPTTPDQILVTLGAQHAIGLILRAYCTPGDRVAVDVPTYPHALDALRDARARPLPVPMDDGLADSGEWERALLGVRPALAYLMPDFHNPTGSSMTEEGRERLVAAAARTGTVLIVDETTAELDIDRPETTTPVPAVRSARAAAVIAVGSASKTMWHGLRIGWIRADTAVIDRIAARRPARDLGTPVLDQLVVASVLPEMDRLLEVRRAHLRRTRDEVLDLLRRRTPEWDVPTVAGGLSLWANLGLPLSSTLASVARTRGLTITSGPRFGLDGAFERHIRIPITAAAEDASAAVAVLAEAWGEASRSTGGPSREFVPML